MYPAYLSNLIIVKRVTVNLRSVNSLVMPKYKTITYGKNSFKYNASFYWTCMPNDEKNAQSIQYFKYIVKDWSPACACGFCLLCKINNM